jgi:tetratricopeptide (TPR) repeat protein
MDNLLFWNSWHKAPRFLYLFFLCLFTGSLLYFTYAYFWGAEQTMYLDTETDLSNVRVVTDSFTQHLFSYQTEAESYLIFKKFVVSDLQISISLTWLTLALVWLSIAAVLASATYLSFFWFYGSMGLLMYLLTTLNTELLGAWQLPANVLLAILIIAFVGLSYFFYAIKKQAGFVSRFVAFFVLVALVAVFLFTGSEAGYPALYLGRYGLILPLIFTVFFILLSSIELVRCFLWLTTWSKVAPGGTTVMLNFTVITFIYLLNVLLAYLKQRGILTWDFLFVDAFILLPLAAIAGLWGFQKRFPRFKNILGNDRAAIFMYVALGTICFSTLAYAFTMANDPLTEALSETILLAQLAFGLSFYLYIVFNFGTPMQKGLPVYKVLFLKTRIPLVAATALATVFAAIFMMQGNFEPYYKARAGYFNAIGDVHRAENELFIAEQYYKEAINNDYYNHRANYSLATLAQQQNDLNLTGYYYSRAIDLKPSVLAYVGLSNNYLQRDRYFDALFVLQEGSQKFPQESVLYNNIALQFIRTNVTDSTYYYFDAAVANTSRYRELLEGNLLAFLAKNRIGSDTAATIAKARYLPYENNLLVIKNAQQTRSKHTLNSRFLPDSVLSNEAFCYLYNLGLNQIKNPDAEVAQAIEHHRQVPANILYYEDLSFIQAQMLYHGGQVQEATRLLESVARSSGAMGPFYFNTLGLWMIEKRAYDEAVHYLKRSFDEGNDNAAMNLALAYAKNGQPLQSAEYWRQLTNDPDTIVRSTASLMQRLLSTTDPGQIRQYSDEYQLQAMYYQQNALNSIAAEKIYSQIQNQEIRSYAAAALMGYYLREQNWTEAEALWQNTREAAMRFPEAASELYIQYAHILTEQRKYRELASWLEQNSKYIAQPYFQEYFKGRALHGTNQLTEAQAAYERSLKLNPYYEENIVSLVALLNSQQQSDAAYEMLVELIDLSPRNAEILKAYVLQAVRVRLQSFAEQAKNRLDSMLSPAEQRSFNQQYLQVQEEVRLSSDQW